MAQFNWNKLEAKERERFGTLAAFMTVESNPLYFLSRMVDQILETMFLCACPICIYMFQEEAIVFTFAAKITVVMTFTSIAVQLGIEFITDFMSLFFEAYLMNINLQVCWRPSCTSCTPT